MTSHILRITENQAVVDKNNRRSDQPVRLAIDAIQNLLFDPQAPSKVFKLVLDHIADITQSEYSVIFLADKLGLTGISSATKMAPSAIYRDNGIAFVRWETLSRWATQKALPNKPLFFNQPIPKNYQSLLLKPDKIKSICLLPIVNHVELRAICVLGKSQSEYSGELISRLLPLLGSVICALQSAESVKGNFLSFGKKIGDNRYLNSLLSSSPIAVVLVAPDKTIVSCNPSAKAMFYPSSNLLEDDNTDAVTLSGTSIDAYLPIYDSIFQWSKQKHRYGEAEPLSGPQVWENQSAIRGDGSQFLINFTVFRYTHANQCFTTLQIQDVTSLRESTEEYQRASQELNALTHLVPVGIIRVDINWSCVYANDKWHDFSGLTPEESKDHQWINAIHSDDVKRLLEELRDSLRMGSDYQTEVRLVSPLGQVSWVDFNTRILFDDNGHVEGFLGAFADVTERLLQEEKLRHVAEYDGLTGLANRNLFQDRLQQAFYTSERDGSAMTVMFLDLDGFKDINDSLGHDAGDLLLQDVAQRLLNVLRRNDTVARFGGDEFVILLGHNSDDNNISYVAQKVIDAIARPSIIMEQEVFVTVSIGISEGAFWSSSPQKILKQADTALYFAKKEGKNNYQLFTESLDKESNKRISLANCLRHAIEKRQFSLHFQAIANVANEKIVGYETLLRFTDDTGKLIQPDDFIPILEETGMIIEVGKWVIEQACKQLRDWQVEGVFPENGFLAFNVSPKQLLDESLVKVISDSCSLYNIDPRILVMEITETVIINKVEKVEKVLNEAKKIGLRLALDDFGTGYSSLSYLQRYPFDHIKVDKSFTDDLSNDSNDAKIIKAIIALANSLGLKVTAEGVENRESFEFIKNFGADYYQGYFLGKPAKNIAKHKGA